MTKNKSSVSTNFVRRSFVRRGLSTAIAIAIVGAFATSAQAFEFGDADGFHGTINTTLSYGIDVRTSDPSSDEIAKAHFNPLVGLQPNAQQRAARGAFSANHDDGDLNYGSSGDVFSNAVKATSEFHLDYGDHMGAFVRASYFYDFENANNDKLTHLAREQVGKRFRILDAFVFDNFNINNQQASVRFGKQVLSW